MDLITKNGRDSVAGLLAGWEETMLWSYLQGFHGKGWADDPNFPGSAQVWVGDFCFFAGRPELELVRNIPPGSGFVLLVPQNAGWMDLIEHCYGQACKKIVRYAFWKEPDAFTEERLWGYVRSLPGKYELRQIGKELYETAQKYAWSRDFCSQFKTYEAYRKYGLGFAAVCSGELVGGASSYTRYCSGIEIEVDTREDFRRRGIALACASRLILECRRLGLYPSWDAANLQSVALAEKLGYRLKGGYTAYELYL